MPYHIETPLNPHMIEQLGKEQAAARLTLAAWQKVIVENQPLRTLTLVSVEECESTMFGGTVKALRFTFQVG